MAVIGTRRKKPRTWPNRICEAFALAAIGQYENAAKALRRGLALKPDWVQAGFQLKSLYGANKIAKIAHRESLAKAVTEHPHSADMMFLLAVVLYCDDDPQRSQAFFRARERWSRATRRTSRAFSTC